MDTVTRDKYDKTLFDFVKKYPNQLNYYFFEKGFSSEECKKICDSFLPKCENEATVFGNSLSEKRRTSVTWIPRNASTNWIYEKLIRMAKEANDAMFNLQVTTLRDDIQFASYDEANQGMYASHVDVGAEDEYSCRKLSISVQLTNPDDYEGGELIINNKLIGKTQGNVIVFPSFLEHEVQPVLKGNRQSLVLWFYGPPYM